MRATAWLQPGRERLLSFHALRVAGRNCPGAAYNLANYLAVERPDRPRRRDMATELLVTASEMAQSRIDIGIDDQSWPDREYFLRDVGSRALTDIGARISNAGKPKEAVQYFRQAIGMFHGNSNAWVCLGNMGVIFSGETGISPIEGMKHWKEAFSMDDPEGDVDGLEADRRHLVGIMEGALRLYGAEEVEEWVDSRLRLTLMKGRKGILQLRPLAMEALDLEEVTGRPWNSTAAEAADLIGELVAEEISQKMELAEKVTIAASLLLSFLNRTTSSETEARQAVASAMQLCDDFEPVHPLLGDEEWESVGPPDTDHLLTPEAKSLYGAIVAELIEAVMDIVEAIRPVDAACAVLFHLDNGFRRGVTSMIEPQIGRMNGQTEYLPAAYVGGAKP